MRNARRICSVWAIGFGLAALLTTWQRASADAGEKRLEGAWAGTVTAVNPPLGSFDDLISFFPGGNVIESRRLYVADSPIGSLVETPAHGEWVRVARRQYQINTVFLLQGGPDNPAAKGTPLGTDNVNLRLELSEDGTSLTGMFKSDVKDVSGNILFTTTGTYVATRIRAKP
jgi:hypothetical protein